MNKSKQIGTDGESGVVRFLKENGFPTAERRALHGSLDLGDITGIPGVVIEVKSGNAARNASMGTIDKWVQESLTECKNAGADIWFLVVQRYAYGPARAGNWRCIM